MTQEFRVEEKVGLDGAPVYYVVDAGRGDKPAAEFDSREAAEAHAADLRAAAEAADIPPETEAGPIHTNP